MPIKQNFSEIAPLRNTTIGTRLYHRFGTKGKIIRGFFNIKGKRRGDDIRDYPVHEANIAKALTYDRFLRKIDLFLIDASTQKYRG